MVEVVKEQCSEVSCFKEHYTVSCQGMMHTRTSILVGLPCICCFILFNTDIADEGTDAWPSHCYRKSASMACDVLQFCELKLHQYIALISTFMCTNLSLTSPCNVLTCACITLWPMPVMQTFFSRKILRLTAGVRDELKFKMAQGCVFQSLSS